MFKDSQLLAELPERFLNERLMAISASLGGGFWDKDISQNLKLRLQETYPEYFETKINWLSEIHDVEGTGQVNEFIAKAGGYLYDGNSDHLHDRIVASEQSAQNEEIIEQTSSFYQNFFAPKELLKGLSKITLEILDDIAGARGGRKTSGAKSAKYEELKGIKRSIDIQLMERTLTYSNEEVMPLIAKVRDCCAKKRHSFNFLAKPHSMIKFNQWLKDKNIDLDQVSSPNSLHR